MLKLILAAVLIAVPIAGAAAYGPVKCTPRGCHEEIRPW